MTTLTIEKLNAMLDELKAIAPPPVHEVVFTPYLVRWVPTELPPAKNRSPRIVKKLLKRLGPGRYVPREPWHSPDGKIYVHSIHRAEFLAQAREVENTRWSEHAHLYLGWPLGGVRVTG